MTSCRKGYDISEFDPEITPSKHEKTRFRKIKMPISSKIEKWERNSNVKCYINKEYYKGYSKNIETYIQTKILKSIQKTEKPARGGA